MKTHGSYVRTPLRTSRAPLPRIEPLETGPSILLDGHDGALGRLPRTLLITG